MQTGSNCSPPTIVICTAGRERAISRIENWLAVNLDERNFLFTGEGMFAEPRPNVFLCIVCRNTHSLNVKHQQQAASLLNCIYPRAF